MGIINKIMKSYPVQGHTRIHGDSKPLRQTLRANNKEHFLLNNLCLLMRHFEVTIDFC